MTTKEKQKAIDALKISAPVRVVTREEFDDYIQTLNKIMNWLEQEPCGDAISRQAALNTIGNVPDYHDGMVWEALSHAQRDVALLPPVTPQSKTGHWIEHPHEAGLNWELSKYECSECHEWADDDSDFCPDCGAKMENDT